MAHDEKVVCEGVGIELYSKVQVRLLESVACRVLSPGAFRVMVDFKIEWDKATRYGTKPCSGIPFTWTSCKWAIGRDTWNGYRREALDRGFIAVTHREVGTYRWSTAWEEYRPTLEEFSNLELDSQKKQSRSAQTLDYREGVGKSNIGSGERGVGKSDPTPKAGKSGTPQGRKIRPYIITNYNNTPLSPPMAETPDGVGGVNIDYDKNEVLRPLLERLMKAATETRADEMFEEDGVRYAMDDGVRVRVWPMPGRCSSTQLLDWARKSDPWLTPEQRKMVVQQFDKLESAEQARQQAALAASSLDAAEAFLKEAEDADDVALGGIVGRYLGDESAAFRITRRIQQAGREIVINAAAGILRNPYGIRSKIGLLLSKTADAA